MRGTKAKALRRLVAHIPLSTAQMRWATHTKPMLTGKIGLDGLPELTPKTFTLPLTFQHNGRRRAYQMAKKEYKMGFGYPI